MANSVVSFFSEIKNIVKQFIVTEIKIVIEKKKTIIKGCKKMSHLIWLYHQFFGDLFYFVLSLDYLPFGVKIN